MNTAISTVVIVHRLRTGATVRVSGGALLIGSDAIGRLTVNAPSRGLRAALEALAAPGRDELDLARLVSENYGESELLGMHMLLARLSAAGMLEHAVRRDETDLATLRVIGRGPSALAPAVPVNARVRVTEHVRIGVGAGLLTARAPRSPLQLTLAPELSPLLPALSEPGAATGTGCEELGERIATASGGLPADGLAEVLRLGVTTGVLQVVHDADEDSGVTGGPAARNGTPASGPQPTAAAGQWEEPDIWLHSASRSPRTVTGYGGTYRGRGVREPEPAIRPPLGTEVLDLPTPDLAAVEAADPPLTRVIEGRRSWRTQNPDHAITAAQLGELLYRSHRLRRTFTDGAGEQVADRPYPSGGAAHELEIYPLVTAADGVPAGLWHYDSAHHRLELVTDDHPALAGLVARARASAVMSADPQVVLLVTARFGRVMYKYQSIGYPLTLKHVGVLYQTLSLVGTAMGLSLCALGGGDADLFAAASGIDYFAEGTVGELVLGSRPDDAGDTDTAWTGEAPR